MSTLFMFMLLAYSLCYYPLIYKFNGKLKAKILLTKTRYTFKSFYFESIYIVFRNFTRAIIHALLITNYDLQILMLAAVDTFYLLISIKMYKCFINKSVAFFCIMYSLVFLSFDLFFTI